MSLEPAYRYCPSCGAANSLQGLTCSACGVSLKTTAPLPPTSAFDASDGQLAPQQMLKGRYRIVQQIGAGGFGAVYKAEDIQDHRLVAIKEIRLDGLTPEQAIDATDAFNREILMLSGLKHPSIPHIYEHFTSSNEWYLIMDFIEGETLEEYRAKTSDGRLPLEHVLRIGIQLCNTLRYLHTRQPPIIFRDLKPANIMLTPQGQLYLIDFGVARQFKSGKARDTIAFGSPGYAGPEQYGRAQTTPRSDIYSLGATLHNLLTSIDPAQTPFQFMPLHSCLEHIPAELDTLIAQMVEMDMSKRPESIAVVQQALQRIATQLATPGKSALAPGASPPAVQPVQAPPTFSTRGVTVYIYRGKARNVLALAWSSDGGQIASTSRFQGVQVWDALNGGHFFSFMFNLRMVNGLAWSPDGEYIACASDDHNVHLCKVALKPQWLRGLILSFGFARHIYKGHAGAVNAVAWQPDGSLLASASNDHTVRLWDTDNHRATLVYRGHMDVVHALAWSPDGKHLASASTDRNVHVWNALNGEKLYPSHRLRSIVRAVAWSPDGRYLALGHNDRSVELRNATTWRKLFVYRHHADGVRALSWSPDSRYLASASKDATVKIWDMVEKKIVFTYDRHAASVETIAWSPNGEYIASGALDSTVHVWRAY